MGDGMNCGYACGIAGILKILTVLFTAVPTGIMFHVTGNATYYKDELPFTEETCKNVKNVADTLNKGADSSANSPCPEKWLGIMALSIFAICCIVSLISLIVLLLVKLNENAIFKQIDFIYHLVAGVGVAVILAGCFAISFGALALNKEVPGCGKGAHDKVKEACVEVRKLIFEPELQIAAGVIGLIAGVIYIITAMKVKKD